MGLHHLVNCYLYYYVSLFEFFKQLKGASKLLSMTFCFLDHKLNI